MGIFNKIFGSSGEREGEAQELPWKSLTDTSQISQVKTDSHHRPQLIFKHSTRCGISRMVINQFKTNYALQEEDADLYYLDVLTHRKESAEVAHFFQLLHESPQLLIIQNGELVASASHGDISNLDITKYM